MNCRIERSRTGLHSITGSDLRIYEYIQDSLRLKFISNEFSFVRSLKWSIVDHQDVVALACNSGRIVIAQVQENSLNVLAETTKNRNCNILVWNPVDSNVLLGGFERARGESGLNVWNVEELFRGGKEFKTVNHFAASQAISSACWLNSSTSVAGVGFRWIRGFDYRDPAGSSLNIVTKAVFGISKDPFHDHRILSFGDDGVIQLWDVRNPSLAILSINSDFSNGLEEASFHPFKPLVVSALEKSSGLVRLWNLLEDQQPLSKPGFTMDPSFEAGSMGSEGTILVPRSERSLVVSLARTVRPTTTTIHHYSWLNSGQLSMIACSGRDATVDIVSIPNIRNTMWCPDGSLGVTGDSDYKQYIPSALSLKRSGSGTVAKSKPVEDVSSIMRQYAIEGYGTNVKRNLDIVKENEALYSAWNLVHHLSSAPFGTFDLLNVNYVSFGINKLILSMPSSNKKTIDLGLSFPLVIYTNQFREVALVMCGWQVGENMTMFQETISRLEYQGNFERAAGLTFLYYADLAKTIECLNSSRNERLMLVAAALAGAFGKSVDENNRNVWKGLCRNLSFQLNDPYLRALFGLLSSDGNWSMVLNESTSLPLCDRMVMALRYLDDQNLSSYISKWMQKLVQQGRIDGLLLTGWTAEGVDLMQAYLDKTSDIQSVALLLSRQASPPDPRIEVWIDTYCNLLDQWQLFKQRALFDIYRQSQSAKEKVPTQIFIRCNFCNQSISQGSKPKKSFVPSTIALTSRSKPTVCPTCSKSLPSCVLCLLAMGTPFEQLQDGSGIVNSCRLCIKV